MPIEITWSLFTTPIVVSISTIFIARLYKKSDKARDVKDETIKKLLEEKEESQARELMEWRDRYARHMCDIKNGISEIKDRMFLKVDIADCNLLQREKWDMINHHSHNENGKVVVE